MDVAKALIAGRVAAEIAALELALDLLNRAQSNNASISNITAEDDAESERSVDLMFTPDESRQIFAAAASAIGPRLASLRDKMSAL